MSDSLPATKRLNASQYFSPYLRSGAPGVTLPPGIEDAYAPLRAKGLAILEAMGFEPQTMVERGVTWADDQDPFGHVMQSKYPQYLSLCWHRAMEDYAEFLSEDDYQALIQAKGIMPLASKYELSIKRQVKYPDTLIIAHRQDSIEPTRSNATTVVLSLRQQAIVAQATATATFVDAKSGRPVDIRTAGEGWLRLYDGFAKKAEAANHLRRKWEQSNSLRRNMAKV